MTQALIKINGSDGSNDNLPIATLVSLDNHGNGGELTYLWSIVDQPSGAADALSSTTIHNPSFTPNKEGTYLLQLVVNQSLPDQATATAIVGVRDLKTFQRLPAARETIEDSSSVGWKNAANSTLQTALNARSDSNLIVCWSHGGAVLNELVKFGGSHVIKSGLPGQETVALTAAAGSSPPIGAIVGPCTPGGPVSNALVLVRVLGLFENSISGSPAVGDPIFIDTGTSLPSLTGTTEVGRVVLSAAGSYRYALHFPPGGGGGGGGAPQMTISRFSPAEGDTVSLVANAVNIIDCQNLVTFIGIALPVAGASPAGTPCEIVFVNLNPVGGALFGAPFAAISQPAGVGFVQILLSGGSDTLNGATGFSATYVKVGDGGRFVTDGIFDWVSTATTWITGFLQAVPILSPGNNQVDFAGASGNLVPESFLVDGLADNTSVIQAMSAGYLGQVTMIVNHDATHTFKISTGFGGSLTGACRPFFGLAAGYTLQPGTSRLLKYYFDFDDSTHGFWYVIGSA